MNRELESIIHNLQNVNTGTPWYGRPVFELLEEVDPAKAFTKPGNSDHSSVELLYHMLTWAEFTLNRVKKDKINDLAAAEKLDWRAIDPQIHGWDEALSAFIATHQEMVAILETKSDDFLEEKVDYRNYNFRFLLNGLIQHNIYHIGQIAYLKKLLG
jgi:uncharacterized damage-inducible protein DinB